MHEGTASLDFSKGLLADHPGGSMPELLTVYGLADTLAENFPYVRQVRILVDGKPVPSIKGHVDLRRPVQADFNYTRPPQGSAAAAAPGAAASTPTSAPAPAGGGAAAAAGAKREQQ